MLNLEKNILGNPKTGQMKNFTCFEKYVTFDKNEFLEIFLNFQAKGCFG
jgi:hypothetical protein